MNDKCIIFVYLRVVKSNIHTGHTAEDNYYTQSQERPRTSPKHLPRQ